MRRETPRRAGSSAAARVAREVAPRAQRAAAGRGVRSRRRRSWERLEEALIYADVGVRATAELMRRLEARQDLTELNAALAEEIAALFGEPPTLDLAHAPAVILVVGVNGTGKTTTIGKLAHKLREHGRDGDARRRRHVPRGGRGAARDLGASARARRSSAASAAAIRPRSPTTRSAPARTS